MKGFVEIYDGKATRLINVKYIQQICAFDNDDNRTTMIVFSDSNKLIFYTLDKRYEVVRAEILEAMK